MREQSDKCKLRGILQDGWPGLKNSDVMNGKKREEFCRLKGTNEAQ